MKQKLDPIKIREDFPVFQMHVEAGKPFIYLDSGATSQIPAPVVEALRAYNQDYHANVHRAFYQLGEEATEQYEAARKKVARFIGAEHAQEIIFTRGTTDSLNQIALSWGRQFISEGDELVVSEMEHHSNLIPWQLLAAEKGAEVKWAPVDADGVLMMDALEDLITERTKLVAVAHMSNVLGTINPIADITKLAHAQGAIVVVDAAQSCPHLPLDVQELGCDFAAFSGHKMMAPTGIGVLFGRKELLEKTEPVIAGGEMVNTVEFTGATWADLPQKFEAGTPNVGGAIGLGAAVDYLSAIGPDHIREYEIGLTQYALEQLQAMKGLTLVGNSPQRGGALAFDMDGIHPHDMAQFADRDGVCIRAGHMCAQPLIKKMGYPALSRASLYIYNTREDVDQLIASIKKAQAFFG